MLPHGVFNDRAQLMAERASFFGNGADAENLPAWLGIR
jgi:hypothetical protein